MSKSILSESELIALTHDLASQNKYMFKRHATKQRLDRKMTVADVKDILLNVSSILRVDTDNIDGITSYKIEGGLHHHRLAIKFPNTYDLIIIITVMDNQNYNK